MTQKDAYALMNTAIENDVKTNEEYIPVCLDAIESDIYTSALGGSYICSVHLKPFFQFKTQNGKIKIYQNIIKILEGREFTIESKFKVYLHDTITVKWMEKE